MAEAFKKAGGQIPRGDVPKHLRRPQAQEETGEEERSRRKSGGAVTPKYYAEYYKHIDKEARATKLIEVLTSEKPRVYKRCSGWTETRGTSRHGPIRGVRANTKVEQPAPRRKLGMMRLNPACRTILVKH